MVMVRNMSEATDLWHCHLKRWCANGPPPPPTREEKKYIKNSPNGILQSASARRFDDSLLLHHFNVYLYLSYFKLVIYKLFPPEKVKTP